jgi:hypothetical protein
VDAAKDEIHVISVKMGRRNETDQKQGRDEVLTSPKAVSFKPATGGFVAASDAKVAERGIKS